MPSFCIGVSLAHLSTGAALAVVEDRRRGVGLSGSVRVQHVHLLETFEPNVGYAVIRSRLVELLDTRALKWNTRVVMAVTASQRRASWDAFGRPGGLRPRLCTFDGEQLRAMLYGAQVSLQQERLAFGPGLAHGERLMQELMALSAQETLEPGVLPGPLALATIAACRYSGYGDERPLPDEPERDRIIPLDLTPAPLSPVYTVWPIG